MRARELKKRQAKTKRSGGELEGSRESEREREGRENPGMRRKEGDGRKKRQNKRVEWQVKCKEKRLRKRERQTEKKDSDGGGSSSAGSLREDSVFVVKGKSMTEKQPEKRRMKKEKSLEKENGGRLLPAASNGPVVNPSLNGRKRRANYSLTVTGIEGEMEAGAAKRQRRNQTKSAVGDQSIPPTKKQSRKVWS